MNYQNGNHSFQPRPFHTGPPFANRGMFQQFPPRGPPFRTPMMRGMPRMCGPPHRMMRPAFGPQHPPMRPHQPGICPPHMMNRPMFSPKQGLKYEKFNNTDSGCVTTNGQSRDFHQETNYNNDASNNNSNQEIIFSCDSCDRNFPSEAIFNKHMSEHKVCGLDGCTFTAHVKIIEKHIEMQHASGIFERMRNLDSPENIAKWIEERKARFPSKENIEKRHKQQEELWKKGIRIGERKNKLGRDNTRMILKDPETRQKEREQFFKKRQEKRDKVIKKFQPKLLFDEKSDWNGNLPPFKGILELFRYEDEEKFAISDDELNDVIEEPAQINNAKQVSALGALAAYGSDYTDDEDELPKEVITKVSETTIHIANDKKDRIEVNVVESDDEGPMEVKIERNTTDTECIAIPKENSTPDESNKRSRKRKSNRKDQNASKKPKKDNNHQFRPHKNSYLAKILDEDIRTERNIILQCALHTVNNNFYMN